MIGFKSFATKTKLVFEPGLTAIVGPNGCGKSNVADAVRWVIGEQSAKALRGSKMQDCIFNGTESRKALGMAEVSITFTDCEELLETEFHEITVTRRVFNSGEGQYFINRTPCRLKDIQRLFMDTGIGTSSYSLMEQGRIDRILSSRPEDRRAIFEEASGITKFKADKKEAIRKLEHTEANLLRLADVIREVKRQIGSLQRQAGKARRYKNFQQELRVLDLYVSRERLKEANAALQKLQVQISDAAKALERTRSEVEALEETTEAQREALMQTERTVPRWDSERARSRVDRLTRIASEAAAQCERNDIPVVHGPRPSADWLETMPKGAVGVLFGARAQGPLMLEGTPEQVWCAVGPEGGFTEAEIASFEEAGFCVASLGAWVLRVETAVPAALAIVQDRIEEC